MITFLINAARLVDCINFKMFMAFFKCAGRYILCFFSFLTLCLKLFGLGNIITFTAGILLSLTCQNIAYSEHTQGCALHVNSKHQCLVSYYMTIIYDMGDSMRNLISHIIVLKSNFFSVICIILNWVFLN